MSDVLQRRWAASTPVAAATEARCSDPTGHAARHSRLQESPHVPGCTLLPGRPRSVTAREGVLASPLVPIPAAGGDGHIRVRTWPRPRARLSGTCTACGSAHGLAPPPGDKAYGARALLPGHSSCTASCRGRPARTGGHGHRDLRCGTTCTCGKTQPPASRGRAEQSRCSHSADHEPERDNSLHVDAEDR